MWTSIQAVTSYELRLRKQVVHKIESMDIRSCGENETDKVC